MNAQTTSEEIRVEQVQAPSPDHAKFDQLCAQVEDFGYLPEQTAPLEERDDEPETDLDGMILAGLVQPV